MKQLDTVTEKWDKQYPGAMKRWKDNWDAVSPIFKFSQEVRSVFPSSQALLKTLYLATFEITKKWTMPICDWGKNCSSCIWAG